MISDPSQLASNPPDDIRQAISEWEHLLKTRISRATEDPSDPGEVDSLVAARLQPKRPLLSGSIALPLPSEPDFENLSFPPREMQLSAVV